jgi:hypothetical protein
MVKVGETEITIDQIGKESITISIVGPHVDIKFPESKTKPFHQSVIRKAHEQ